MGRYGASWVAAAKAGSVLPVITIAFPSGTKYYAPTGADETTPYESRVLSIGRVSVGASERSGALGFPQWSFTLAEDERRELTLLFESQEPSGAAVTLQWLAPNQDPLVNTSLAATLATSVLHRWRRLRPGIWELTCTPDWRPLKTKVTKQPILKGEYPLATGSPWGSYMPQVYGIHESSGLAGAGMIPGINISYDATAGRYWLLSQGFVRAAPGVFVDGVDATTDFSLVRAVVAGKAISYVKFIGGGAPPAAGAEITADVEGYETLDDGTGPVITNPVAQLRHWLSYYGLGNYLSSAGPGIDPLIDTPSWTVAETWAAKYGLEGAIYVGGSTEQVEAIDVVN